VDGKKKSSTESEEKKADSKSSEEESEEKAESGEEKKKAVSNGPFRKVKECKGQEWEQPHSVTKAAKKCLAQRKKDKEDKVKDSKRGPAVIS